MAVLGLRCCLPAFFSCVEQGPLSSCSAVCRVFIVVASLFEEHGLSGMQASVVAVHRLSWPEAYEVLVPGPGIKPVSPKLAGGFLTTGPKDVILQWLIKWSREAECSWEISSGLQRPNYFHDNPNVTCIFSLVRTILIEDREAIVIIPDI